MIRCTRYYLDWRLFAPAYSKRRVEITRSNKVSSYCPSSNNNTANDDHKKRRRITLPTFTEKEDGDGNILKMKRSKTWGEIVEELLPDEIGITKSSQSNSEKNSYYDQSKNRSLKNDISNITSFISAELNAYGMSNVTSFISTELNSSDEQ